MADTIESVDIAGVHGQVALNPDGTAIGTPVGGATSANQTNGTQKTQIVDAGGEAVTVTGGKLDVNATIDTTGLATTTTDTNTTTIAGDTTSIDAKTPALGQALASGSVPVVLTAAQITTLTPPAAITGFATAANQLPDGHNVTVDNASLAVTNAGTFAVQAASTLAAETTKVIGTVNIASAQTLATVTTVGAVTAITNALPAGTNTIGAVKSVPSDIDSNGGNTNHADKYYTNAGAVTDGIIWSPAAGKRWHVLNLTINVSAAATVTIEDDLAAGDNPRLKFELAANSGIALKYDKEHPFSSTEDAADLLITTTAGNVYVQALGYEI